jgi:Family of unknown function (DUF6494)
MRAFILRQPDSQLQCSNENGTYAQRCGLLKMPVSRALAANAADATSVFAASPMESAMNEDVFNTSIRKFLKVVGVTSQREIEKAVRAAIAAGQIKGNEQLPATMVLTINGISLTHTVEDTIDLA